MSDTVTGEDVKSRLPVESVTVYDTSICFGSLTATWIFAETSTWPPALVNGGIGHDARDE